MSEFRLLTREELATVPGMVSPMPQSLFGVGLVDEQGVAAAIGVFLVLHADPIWIREDKRFSGKLPLELWEATKALVAKENLGPELLWVGMTENKPGQPTEGLVERMVRKAGGEELRARFFAIPIEERTWE